MEKKEEERITYGSEDIMDGLSVWMSARVSPTGAMQLRLMETFLKPERFCVTSVTFFFLCIPHV